MEMAGHKCLGHCEWDKFANYSYAAMHLLPAEELDLLKEMSVRDAQKYIDNRPQGGEWFAQDIREIRANNIPRCDCWCFGFPCQDISIAGEQHGFAGKRSSLFFAVTKLIRELEEKDRPTYLFIENVKNLLSINRGFDFAKLLIELDEIGYNAEWQVLNSANFGVPQNRERVFAVGHLRSRGECGHEVFPIGRTNKQTDIPVQLIAHKNGYRRNTQTFSPYGITEALDTGQGGGKGMSSRSGEVSGVAVPVLTPDRLTKRQNGRRFKNNGEPMFTLTSQDRHGVAILTPKRTEYGKAIRKQYESGEILESRHNMTKLEPRSDGISNTITTVQKDNLLKIGYRIRKLTPKECFRLQGFPDEYFNRARLVNSDSQLYKQAGNGVTVNVIYEIAKRMEVQEDEPKTST